MKERIISLDVFRGLTVMLMVLVNNHGDEENTFSQLLHADWNGCTLTDLVFPFFIFIMGAAIPMAITTKKIDSEIFLKIFTRSMRIFCLGLFLNFFRILNFPDLPGLVVVAIRLSLSAVAGYILLGNFSQKIKLYSVLAVFTVLMILAYWGGEYFASVRILGVLQRIAIVYFVGSILYLTTELRTQIVIAVILLFSYWAMMTLIPVPGYGVASLDIHVNLAAWVDEVVLHDHVYSYTKPWDPEGVLSTIPSIATGIIGLLIGKIIIGFEGKINKFKKMLTYGILLIALGFLWSQVFPFNKRLWSSSYAIYTAGLASFVWALLYYFIDIADYKKWIKSILYWGVNPMIVFFLSGMIPRLFKLIEVRNPENKTETINLEDYLYNYRVSPFFENPKISSLVWALCHVSFWFIVLRFFYNRKMIFKV